MANAIEASGLVKKYGKVTALAGLDLAAAEGTILGVLGPNGAGKTTAVSILTTLIEPDAGEATIAGIDLRKDPHGVRSRIGLSGQAVAVDEQLTGFENLDMSRRLDLAGALMAEPPVLFLDEPTAGLDPRSRSDLWTVIRELVGRGTTLLLTTQYLEEADQLANDIVVIDHGREIAHGTSREIQHDPGMNTLVAPIAGGAEILTQVLRALDAEGVTVEDIGLRRPTLDDVFLTITGRHADEETTKDDGKPGKPGGVQ